MPLQTWLICYDISDDRRRSKVAALLDSLGDRIQFSVFEILVPPQAIKDLQAKLTNIIHLEEDMVGMYPLCARCRDHHLWIGKPLETSLDEDQDFVL